MTTSSADAVLFELDLYQLLDPSRVLTSSSPASHVSRAYRQRARALHPDKNPDLADAAAQFDRLQRAYELLSDEQRRAEYDERWRRKEERKRKRAAEDDDLSRMRQRLQQRELEAAQSRAGQRTGAAQPQPHSDAAQQQSRIQRENAAAIAELRAAAAQSAPRPPQPSSASSVALTLTQAVDEAALRAHFSRYGRVEHVMLRKGKAFVAFFDVRAALAAAAGERGGDARWTLSRLGDKDAPGTPPQNAHADDRKDGPSAAAELPAVADLKAYEAATLTKLRALAQRKKEQQHQQQLHEAAAASSRPSPTVLADDDDDVQIVPPPSSDSAG